MELYQQQQFGFFLETATHRYAARLEERFRGASGALESLRGNPEADGVWLMQFTEAVFDDFLLNNVEGACFVLQALARRNVPATTKGTIESTLIEMAKLAFAELLRKKTIETLELNSGYQAV